MPLDDDWYPGQSIEHDNDNDRKPTLGTAVGDFIDSDFGKAFIAGAIIHHFWRGHQERKAERAQAKQDAINFQAAQAAQAERSAKLAKVQYAQQQQVDWWRQVAKEQREGRTDTLDKGMPDFGSSWK